MNGKEMTGSSSDVLVMVESQGIAIKDIRPKMVGKQPSEWVSDDFIMLGRRRSLCRFSR